MSKLRKRNGYSIVEVVIALAVIVTVSMTALSIALSSVAAKVNVINRSYAQGFADNVWESFKVAQSQDEFLSLIVFSEGTMLTEKANDGNGKVTYIYYSQKNKFSSEIVVSYEENARPELEVVVTDKNGGEIISFSYRKGGGI